MKYIRKIAWMLITVVFLATIIIGIGVIFAVKNVNVTLRTYKYPEWELMSAEERVLAEEESKAFKDEVLSKFRGKMIGFVNERKIAECFKDTDYVFSGLEKEYPCTLNITLSERRETFAVADGAGRYKTYDAEGKFLESGATGYNGLDGAPDIFVNGSPTDEDMIKIAEISAVFSSQRYFASLRSSVQSVDLRAQDGVITFIMRCGMAVEIADFTNLAETKVKKAYDKFMSLTGEEKLSGTIVVTVRADDGEVFAERIPASR